MSPSTNQCGVLAATELLSAEDGFGGRYGLVRDRHTGYLTVTLRVAPVSTWLADAADADRWVANWAGWLASLGYIGWLRWVTVTVDTAPDPGSTLTDQVAAAVDPSAPRAALEIMDQVVAAAPAAAADVGTLVSITFDPKACPAQPATVDEAVAEVGQVLTGLESALGSCGVTVLGRARAVDLAAAVRTAFDPAVRGEISRLLATAIGPTLEDRLNWASAGPVWAAEHPECYQHDSGTSVSWTWREAPRQNVTSDVLARLLAPGSYPKRVALQYRPLPASAAPRTLDSEVRAAEFRHEYSRRTRRDVSARDLHDHARARQAADEEARGAGWPPRAALGAMLPAWCSPRRGTLAGGSSTGRRPRRRAWPAPRLRARARRVLQVAAAHRHRRLVLGAWGCGVFGNDPAVVAAVFAPGSEPGPLVRADRVRGV